MAENLDAVRVRDDGPVRIVTLSRPEVRNAVDRTTATALADAFLAFDADEAAKVAVFHGAHGTFCAGADLKAVASGKGGNRVESPATGEGFNPLDPSGPMGPTRLVLNKPVIAAIAGHAVAGGMELALWCDLRVMEQSAVMGIFCRRWGVPLIDGGTVRLPRLIGHSRAMDLILTGRAVAADEALAMGLANRVVPDGEGLEAAVTLAKEIAAFPETCMREDRLSAIEGWDLPYDKAMANEIRHGLRSLSGNKARDGAARFAGGKGRGGDFKNI